MTATRWAVPNRAFTRLPNASLVLPIILPGTESNSISPMDNSQEKNVLE